MFRHAQNSVAGDGEHTREPIASFAASTGRFSHGTDRQRRLTGVGQEPSPVLGGKTRRAKVRRLRPDPRASDNWEYDAVSPGIRLGHDSPDSGIPLDTIESPMILEEESDWEEDPTGVRDSFLLVACISCPRMVSIEYNSEKLVEAHSNIDLTNKLVMITCGRCEMDPAIMGTKFGTLQEHRKGYAPGVHVNHVSRSPLLAAARIVAGQDVLFAQMNERVLYVRKDAIRTLGSGEGKMRGLNLAKLETNDPAELVLPFAPVDFL